VAVFAFFFGMTCLSLLESEIRAGVLTAEGRDENTGAAQLVRRLTNQSSAGVKNEPRAR
jgi:hypothetical protein